jgi:hypothetical protein
MPSITSEERRRRRTGGDEVDADGVAAAPAEEDEEEEEDADGVKMMRSVAITQLCRLSRTSTQARSRDDRCSRGRGRGFEMILNPAVEQSLLVF